MWGIIICPFRTFSLFFFIDEHHQISNVSQLELFLEHTKSIVLSLQVDYVMGCLEMEMQLLTKAEADADPVGAKRKEPNHVSEEGW